MKLRPLVLRHQIGEKTKALTELEAKDADFAEREKTITEAIETAATQEEREAVEALVNTFDSESDEHETAKNTLRGEISAMQEELNEIEAQAPSGMAHPTAENKNERTDSAMIPAINVRELPMGKRAFDALSYEQRRSIVAQDDVKTFLAQLRSFKGVKTSVSGADLLVPEILLDLISENRYRYSKLLNRVRRRNLRGKGKQPVAGVIPPAVWTGRCKKLNSLTLVFNAVELDDFKNAGIIPVCNADLEDSDIDLVAFIVEAISESLGLSDDMAILYGKGAAYTMPTGVVTRLAQTSKPEGYPDDAPEWVDLHTTNIITINGPGITAQEFWEKLNEATGNTFTKYSRGELSWCMNSKTYNYLKGKAIATTATGEWVSLIGGALPIVSGQIDVLEFMPNYDIVGGYFDLYLWGQRRGITIGQDDMGLLNRINDTTVFFGKERADGLPVIAGAFVAMNIHNSAPTTTILFPSDDANTVSGLLMDTATASIVGTGTVQLHAIPLPFGVEGAVTWASGTTAKATVNSSGLVTGVTAGSSVITATCNGYTAQCTVTVT